MKKVLVIITHPKLDTSAINKRWVEALNKHISSGLCVGPNIFNTD